MSHEASGGLDPFPRRRFDDPVIVEALVRDFAPPRIVGMLDFPSLEEVGRLAELPAAESPAKDGPLQQAAAPSASVRASGQKDGRRQPPHPGEPWIAIPSPPHRPTRRTARS